MTEQPIVIELTRRLFMKWSGLCSAIGALSDLVPPVARTGERPELSPGRGEIVNDADAEIRAEFEEYGFVVLNEVIPRRDAARLERRVVEIMGRQPDAHKVDQHVSGFFNYLEPKDYIDFLPLVTQPACLALARATLGEGFQMTEVGCRWRKPGAPEGPIHPTRPLESLARAGLPVPNINFVLAFSWMLNDLTKDMGATFYLPFSHHSPRGPRAGVRYKQLVPIEAPAGSVVVHHSALWHNFGANTSSGKARVGLMGGYFPYWMDPVAVGWTPMKRSVRDRMPPEIQKMNAHVIDG